jgi:acyl phosphate:glycerol-3-phosphate acyltransferase
MIDFITQIQDKIWLVIVICSIAGYFIGAISFARLINFMVTKTTKISLFSEPVPHSDEIFESDLISATLVTKRLGVKYGCMTSVLDMLKVALPSLFIKLTFTAHPFFLLTALFGIIGHNYPVYHKFVGGRGESPILGSLLVINWFGILIANAAATVLGFITGSVLVVRWGGYFILIFWFWYYFNDIFYVAFMVVANIVFYMAMSKDLLRFRELKVKKGIDFTEEDVSEFILMGRSLGRALDKYSLYYIIRRRLNLKNKL